MSQSCKKIATQSDLNELKAFFQANSTFDIRWKKGLFKDEISPAVYFSEFMDQGYTKKELTKFIQAGFLSQTQYVDPYHANLRSVLVLRAVKKPQLEPMKRLLSGDVSFRGLTRDLKKKLLSLEGLFSILILVAMIFILSVGFILIQARSASALARNPNTLLGFIHEGYVSLDVTGGRFTDVEKKVTCYYLIHKDSHSIAMECLSERTPHENAQDSEEPQGTRPKHQIRSRVSAQPR